MNWLSDAAGRALEVVKSPLLLLTCFIFSSAFFLLPDEIQTALGFDAVEGGVRAIIGIVWLLSASGLAAHGIAAAVNLARQWRAERIRAREKEDESKRAAAEQARAAAAQAQVVEALVNGIGGLSDDEFAWVMTAVRDRQQTIYPMHSDPVAFSLVDKGYLTLGTGGTAMAYPFHFVSDVWGALMANRERILSEYAEWSSRNPARDDY